MDEAQQLKEVTCLFVQMGADETRAEVMASQLLKRACQISAERDISFMEALEDLLRKVVEARHGASPRTTSGLEGPAAPER